MPIPKVSLVRDLYDDGRRAIDGVFEIGRRTDAAMERVFNAPTLVPLSMTKRLRSFMPIYDGVKVIEVEKFDHEQDYIMILLDHDRVDSRLDSLINNSDFTVDVIKFKASENVVSISVKAYNPQGLQIQGSYLANLLDKASARNY